MSDQHDRQEHYDIEYVELVAVWLQTAIIKVHEEYRKSYIHHGKDTLTLDKPKALLRRIVDMSSTTYYHEAINNYTKSRNEQLKINLTQKPLGIRR